MTTGYYRYFTILLSLVFLDFLLWEKPSIKVNII